MPDGRDRLHQLPPGCPFSDRCAWAIEACRQALPAAVPLGPDHDARCIRLPEVNA